MNNKGLTLVELVIAIFISSIVIINVFELFSTINTRLSIEREKSILHEEIGRVMGVIEKDIRHTGLNIEGTGISYEDGVFSFLIEDNDVLRKKFYKIENGKLIVGYDDKRIPLSNKIHILHFSPRNSNGDINYIDLDDIRYFDVEIGGNLFFWWLYL